MKRRKEGGFLLLYYICAGAILAFGTASPWISLVFLFAPIYFALLGSGLLPAAWLARFEGAEAPWIAGLSSLMICIAWGICLATLAWGCSMVLTGSYFAGQIVLGAIVLLGLVRCKRPARQWAQALKLPGLSLYVGAIWVGAYYIYGMNGISFSPIFNMYTFVSDVPSHMQWSQLLANHGFPTVEPTGAPGNPYFSLYHWGYMILTGGLHHLTRLPNLEVMRLMAMIFAPLMVLSALCLVGTLEISRRAKYLAASSVFLLGGFRFFSYLGIYNHFGIFISPMSYIPNPRFGWSVVACTFHNMTQCAAVALCMAGFLGLRLFFQRKSTSGLWLGLGIIAIGCNFKLSLGIVIFPALLLVSLLTLQNWRVWLMILGWMGIMAALYVSPIILSDVPLSWHQWSIDPFYLSLPIQWGILIQDMGIIALFFLVQTGTMAYRALKREPFDWDDVATVALGGAILFMMLFREVGREHHGNHMWPFYGMVALLAPWAIATTFSWVRTLRDKARVRYRKWAALLSIAMVVTIGAQIVSGLAYALTYPHIYKTYLDKRLLAQLKQAYVHIPPKSRILLDPLLAEIPNIQLYVPYQTYFKWPSPAPRSQQEFQAWQQAYLSPYQNRKKLKQIVSRRHAIIVGPKLQSIQRYLRAWGWRYQKTITWGQIRLNLWLNPTLIKRKPTPTPLID